MNTNEKETKFENEKSAKRENQKGHRNKNKKKYGKKKKSYNNDGHKKISNFKGSIENMNGHVFEMFGEGAPTTQFTRTCEELEGYALRTYRYGTDMQYLIKNFEEPTVEVPDDPVASVKSEGGKMTVSESQKYIWHAELKDHVLRVRMKKENKANMYSVIWAQCSRAMQAKLKTSSQFGKIEKTYDCLAMLEEIKCISYKFETRGYIYTSLHEAKTAFFKVFQYKSESDNEYLTRFRAIVGIIEHYKGNIGDDTVLVHTEIKRGGINVNVDTHIPGNSIYDSHIEAAKDRTLALAFIQGADRNRYAQLHIDLVNSFSRGQDIYPVNVTEAYNMIVNHVDSAKQNPKHRTQRKEVQSESESDTETAFVQKGAEHITCFDCGEKGHYKGSKECSGKKSITTEALLLNAAGVQSDSESDLDWNMVNMSHVMTNSSEENKTTRTEEILLSEGKISPYWILLDSESTIDIFKDAKLLNNVRTVKKGNEMTCWTNGGKHHTNQVGDVPGYDTVWYNPTSLANILSLARVTRYFRVTMDTHEEQCFNVHKGDGTIQKFIKSPRGLYYHDIRWDRTSNVLTNVDMATVKSNKLQVTPRSLKRADKAKRLYGMIGRPTHRDFITILKSNSLRNNNVNPEDANMATNIYGPSVAALAGKTIRTRPSTVNITVTPVP